MPAPVFVKFPVLEISPDKVPVPEDIFIVLVPVTVISLLALIPAERANVVPSAIANAPDPSPVLLLRVNCPAERVVPPEYVLLEPDNTTVSTPAFTSVPVPVISPEAVAVIPPPLSERVAIVAVPVTVKSLLKLKL